MSWWSWGADANLAGRAGYVPGGTNDPVLDTQTMALPDDIIYLAVQQDAGAAVTSTGDLWGWGIVNRSDFYQPGESFFGNALLGVNTDPGGTDHMVLNPPAKFPYSQATSVKQVALTQEATFWLRTDGTVWGVGRNWNGEFGIGENPLAAPNGSYWYHGTPVQLTGLPSGITWIYAHTYGYGLFAIDSLNRLWYSGYDASCATGYGVPHGPGGPTDVYVLAHMLVNGLPSSVADVVVAVNGDLTGQNFSYAALLSNGTVMWWGRSMMETSPPVITFHTPSLYSGIAGIKQVAANGPLLLLTTVGVVLGIGSDAGGKLSNGTWSGPPYGPFANYTPADHFALPPVTISLPGGHTPVRFAHGDSAASAMFVISSDSQVWGWGRNEYFWGTSDPSGDPITSSSVISPPYPVFPDVFRLPPDTDTPGCPATDVTVMSASALFVDACTPVRVAIPSRLATIVG